MRDAIFFFFSLPFSTILVGYFPRIQVAQRDYLNSTISSPTGLFLEFRSPGRWDYAICRALQDIHVYMRPDMKASRNNSLLLALNPSNAEATFIQSTRTQIFLKAIEPCRVGIHWNALTEYFHMSTHLPGFRSLFRAFASYCIDQISQQQHKG